jgi:hypothetical protein
LDRQIKEGSQIAYRHLPGKSSSVDSATAEDWKNYRILQEIECYDFCDIKMTQLVKGA